MRSQLSEYTGSTDLSRGPNKVSVPRLHDPGTWSYSLQPEDYLDTMLITIS